MPFRPCRASLTASEGGPRAFARRGRNQPGCGYGRNLLALLDPSRPSPYSDTEIQSQQACPAFPPGCPVLSSALLPLECLRPGEWAEVCDVSGEPTWIARLAELGIR